MFPVNDIPELELYQPNTIIVFKKFFFFFFNPWKCTTTRLELYQNYKQKETEKLRVRERQRQRQRQTCAQEHKVDSSVISWGGDNVLFRWGHGLMDPSKRVPGPGPAFFRIQTLQDPIRVVNHAVPRLTRQPCEQHHQNYEYQKGCP